MKKIFLFLLFVEMAGSPFAEGAVAPAQTLPSLFSLTLMPNYTVPIGPDGSLGGGIAGSRWFAPGWGLTISGQYRLPASPLFVGADFGYSWVPYGDWASLGVDPYEAWPGYSSVPGDAVTRISMWQAGLTAGLHWNFLPTLGVRGFGSAGYSYNLLSRGAGRGGTPFVCAGAELSWAFIPELSLTAGARYRHFVDFYADVAVTLGISYNLLVGGPKAMELHPQRVAPFKNAPRPKPAARSAAGVEKLLSFLAPTAVLPLSSRVSACVEPYVNQALDKNLQTAIGLHEALLLLGITWLASPPEDGKAADSAKSPLRTLQDGSGDYRDLSVLYCSLLQSRDVDTAFLATPGHVFVALALASGEEEARRVFSHTEDLIFRDGKAWVPVDAAHGEGSFLSAWRAGAAEWRKARKQARFLAVGAGDTQGLEDYEWSSGELPLPDQVQLARNFQREIARLAEWEIHDREAQLLAAVGNGGDSPGTLNALGVLYARYGLCDEAEARFQSAVEAGEYVPALVNLGNLRLLGNLPEEALGFYQRAAAVAPHDEKVLLGLARSHHELQDYELAKAEYDELKTRSARLAEQFSYLGLPDEATPAAEANQAKHVMVWGEEK